MRFPKTLIPAFKKAIEDVKELSGQVRRKHHAYKQLYPHSSKQHKVEFAGDGNELFGAYYNVQETNKYRIIKFENAEGENLSSSHRELLVLHRCVKENAKLYKTTTLFITQTPEFSFTGICTVPLTRMLQTFFAK